MLAFITVRALAFAWLTCWPAFAATVTVEVRGLPKPPAIVPLDEKIAAKAATVFGARCAFCHGASGEGDGVSAALLSPKPRRFSDALWQASVSDQQLHQVILQGGKSRKLSSLMIASPDLKDTPGVMDALVAYIRSRRAAHGTARLVLGTAPPVVLDVPADEKGGIVRFEVKDVAAGSHPIAVHGVNGLHCKATAVVASADVVVVCAR